MNYLHYETYLQYRELQTKAIASALPKLPFLQPLTDLHSRIPIPS